MKNAEIVGAHMLAGARALMDKHPIIGDVRGRGLMIGLELVRDRQTKERATKERDAVVRDCFARGLLVLGAGQNAIRLSPPLVLTRQQADTALEILDQALAGVRVYRGLTPGQTPTGFCQLWLTSTRAAARAASRNTRRSTPRRRSRCRAGR